MKRLFLNARNLSCDCGGGGDRNSLINYGINTAGFMAQNMATQGGVLGYLTNPFEVPQQLVLTGTASASDTPKTYMAVDDACGLGVAFGLIDITTNTAGVEFTAVGGLTIAALKKFLQTYALIIVGFNFESTKSSQLSQNLRAIYTSVDGNSKSKQMFSAITVSNMQYNANLLNVNQSFVYTNQCALKINVVANSAAVGTDVTYTFTFNIGGAVPYGKLDEFLAAAQIPERSRMSC